MELKSNIPSGPIDKKWDKHRFEMKLVNPANKRKYSVIVVGTGLAGGAGAASMAELGYNVKVFCYQDSARRAHSIAAQGGINAAKNYHNDGDSVFRLFFDTVKGGDFRAREANVYRLAEVSNNIIDQCVAQGVPFAREYGGGLDNRSFGGALVSRTFYARGQTGQQLLLGAYQALMRQVGLGKVDMFTRHEMLELVVIDGRARGIVARDMVTGKLETHLADAVVLATGGYGNVFYLATYAKGCNGSAAWRAYKKGAAFANPCFTQIHPTCIPVHGDYQSKLTLMSESLRNDGRIWVPKRVRSRRTSATTTWSGSTRHSGTSPPATSPRGRPSGSATRDAASAPASGVSTSTLPTPSAASGRTRSKKSTGTSSRCTSGSPTRTLTTYPCGSTPPATTPWAGCGWTTTS
jgi:succinate dehydrogenase / fumarate reductase flavoprotein subunit